jgi:CubicO group peptidase (beta-lactamase class C family)
MDGMRRAPLFLLSTALVLLLASAALHADPVDDYVRAELARQKIPGVAVVVTRAGKIVKAAGYGFANLEHQVPVKPETVFQSGSTGKQFAAALAMLLVEDGKLELDKPVKTYLPDAPPAWDTITVRHLLTHTSGIPDYGDAQFDLRRDYTDEERLKIIYAMPLEFSPGQRWSYTNTGYVTLGILVSRVGGAFYGDQLAKRIFAPLGMTTARILSEADVIPNRAAGYRLEGDEIKNQEWVSPSNNTTADGAIYWTVLDLAKWADAQRRGAVLKAESWREMTTPVRLNSGKTFPYGFGLFIDDWNGKKVIDHGGAWQGFTAQLARRLGDDELAVAVLSNREGADSDLIARGVMALYEPELARDDHAIEDKEPEATARVQAFLARFAAGGAKREDFAYLRGGYQETLAEELQKMLSPLGKLQSLELFERREAGDDVRRRYRVRFEKGETADLFIQLTADGKISGIGMRKRS